MAQGSPSKNGTPAGLGTRASDRDVQISFWRNLRWSFLPPLGVYAVASGMALTNVVGVFVIKDYLNLSAAFVASLGFWIGLPWATKIIFGHLVDLIWPYRNALIVLGAAAISLSNYLIYALLTGAHELTSVMSVETWFIAASVLAPVGYVLQDVVADAMTVEAVSNVDDDGSRLHESEVKAMHVTMQMLGRAATIGGFAIVSALNIWMFDDLARMPDATKLGVYAQVYLIASMIPVLSVLAMLLAVWLRQRRRTRLLRHGLPAEQVNALVGDNRAGEPISPDWRILGGGLALAVTTVLAVTGSLALAEEVVFLASLAISIFLGAHLLGMIDPRVRRMLIGTAIIIFVFRAMPTANPGAQWWQIDILGFDEQFFSVLSLISFSLALVGMVLLRPLMVRDSVAHITVILAVVFFVMNLPNIGLYFGLHEWTSALTVGVVDARFIAIADTALEAPFGQIAIIPVLVWIARYALPHLKATYFAVLASFINLSHAASSLLTKYINMIFEITREVRDPETRDILTAQDYSELGFLLISVATLALIVPLLVIAVVQRSRLRTQQ